MCHFDELTIWSSAWFNSSMTENLYISLFSCSFTFSSSDCSAGPIGAVWYIRWDSLPGQQWTAAYAYRYLVPIDQHPVSTCTLFLFYFSSTCHSNAPLWFENYGVFISPKGLSIFTALNICRVTADLRRGSLSDVVTRYDRPCESDYDYFFSVAVNYYRLWKTQGCLILGFRLVHAIYGSLSDLVYCSSV